MALARAFAVVATLSLAPFAGAVVAADDAGVHDFLMGRSPAAPPALVPSDRSLPITVSPRRRHEAAGSGRVHFREAAGSGRVHFREADTSAPTPRLAAKFEWRGDPVWYLRDETLRSGDIIVLADKMVRFKGAGRAPFSPSDFTVLSKAEIERARLGAIAEGDASTPG